MTTEPLVDEARSALHAFSLESGRATRYRMHRVDEVLTLPYVNWVVDGWICEGGYSVFYGPPGVGKTAVLLNLAVAVAAGTSWMGRTVTQGGVLFVAAEGLAGLNRRLGAALDSHGIDRRRRRSLPLRVIDDSPDLTRPESLAGVVRAAERMRGGCRLVVIDPLVECMAGDENGEGMQLASDGARFIARHLDAAVILGHHTEAKGLAERGNKRLRARAFTMVKLSSSGSTRTLSTDKQRHGPDYELQFALEEAGGSIVSELISNSEHLRGTRTRAGTDYSVAPTAEAIILDTLAKLAPCSSSALIRAAKSQGRGDKVLRTALHALTERGEVLKKVDGHK